MILNYFNYYLIFGILGDGKKEEVTKRKQETRGRKSAAQQASRAAIGKLGHIIYF